MRFILLYILLNSAFISFAQMNKNYYFSPDSIKFRIKQELYPPVEVKPLFYIPLRAVNSFPLSLRLGSHIYMPALENNSELNTDLLYPVMSINDQNKLSFLYTVLGAVQSGAVGYLAYQHIKKFGLLK